MPSTLHGRGRIAPPLPPDAPIHRRVVRFVLRVGQGLVLHDAFRVAPAMAFHFFLSLLPLLCFVGYLVGSIARRRGVETVISPLLDSLPSGTEAVVKKEVLRLAGASTLGPLAALGFLWVASGGVHGLTNAVEALVGTPRRPWWKKRLMALAWVTVSLFAIGLTSLGLIEWDAFVHPHEPIAEITSTTTTEILPAPTATTGSKLGKSGASAHAGASASGSAAMATTATTTNTGPSSFRSPKRRARAVLRGEGERALALGLSLAGAIAGLAGFYWFSVSHSRPVKRRVLPGALLAIGSWLAISWVFGLYVRSLATYAVYYGSLAAVAVLLVWLWLTSLTILVGAELNAQLEGLRD